MSAVPPNRVRAAAQLRAAADYIDLRGWTQNTYETSDGRVCVSRALHAAGVPVGKLAARLMFCEYMGGSHVSLLRWNDAPGRTKAEVTGALRACASHLEQAP